MENQEIFLQNNYYVDKINIFITYSPIHHQNNNQGQNPENYSQHRKNKKKKNKKKKRKKHQQCSQEYLQENEFNRKGRTRFRTKNADLNSMPTNSTSFMDDESLMKKLNIQICGLNIHTNEESEEEDTILEDVEDLLLDTHDILGETSKKIKKELNLFPTILSEVVQKDLSTNVEINQKDEKE
ncbi:hypothetical protein AB837_00459 [bacterium AB1]|nr:hypothetical protein AB837_00459 [bacterium AB1]